MKTTYSPIERTIARFMGKFPFLKKLIKACYSRLVYLKSKKNYAFHTVFPLQEIGNGLDEESFFGYYDKSPQNSDKHVLCHLSGSETSKKPSTNNPVSLTLYGCKKGAFIWQLPVYSYNWQQGCRAHWLDNEQFIFNDFDNEGQRYIARVFSLDTLKEIKLFDYPVQDSFATDYFLSINYCRLFALRPDYGYRNLPPLNQRELDDTSNDGIWRVEFDSGEARLLYSLAQILGVDKKPVFDKCIHKVNHVMISPSGGQFVFLHRYYQGKKKLDRLMIAGADGGWMRVISDYGMASHYFWIDEKTILGYMRGPDGKDGYWIINLDTGSFTNFAGGALDKYGDGHPHVLGDWFVTDTYPDKARMQHLILANWKTGEIRGLGEFFHGFKYGGETRCDLHPRFSPDGKSVFFDSVFSGKRKLYRMDLDS